MIRLTVEGVPPWDGVYEFPDFRLSQRELHRIKLLSGIRAGELIEALDANDTAAMVGLAVVVLARGGKVVDPDDLWDSPIGSLSLEIVADVEGDDADPPTMLPAGSGTESTGAGGGDGSVSGGG